MKYRFAALAALAVVVAGVTAPGCGDGATVPEEVIVPAEPRGMISRMEGGKVRLLTDDEAKTVCGRQHCEPDYAYQEAFGRKRVKPPEPDVVVPQPTQGKPADAAGETHDYSKNKMRVYDAWQLTRGSPEVVVAVIDSGLDTSHPDIRDNLWVNLAEKNGRSGVDDDRNGYIDDVNGWDFVNDTPISTGSTDHGTHVAGTIAAAVNGRGTAGVAPRVKVMALKFIASNGNGYTSDAVAAMEYAAKNGAHVINNSWGGSSYSSYLEEAVTDTIAQGVIFVAAAGNNGKNTDYSGFYPANYEGVLSVGSTTESDELSSFSNFGPDTVEVAAPGSNIYSTFRGNTYATISGTSMASPQVAGVLALGISLRRDLPLTRIRSELCATSVNLFPEYVRCGRVDAYAYLQKLAGI